MSGSKVALITGASRNIGFDIASRFSALGMQVIATARDQGTLEAAFASAGVQGVACIGADLNDDDSIAALVAEVEQRFGHVDILVNLAVQRTTYPFAEHPIDEFRMALQVSLVSAFQLMQAFIPGMVERGWGRVINFGGLSGQTGARNRSSVSATKAGLAGLSRTIALEVAEHGVTVNTVSPGPIETARGEWTTTGDLTALSELYEKRRQAIPVKRRGSIDEVVALCEYLASDRAGFMTGQNIQLNGGLLMT